MTPRLCVVESGSPEIASVLRLEKEAFGDGAMSIWAVEPFCVHGRCQLFRLGDEVLAEALWLPDWRDPTLAYLFSFAVAGPHRGRGWGRRVLALALEDLRKQGKTSFELTVDPGNAAARALYRGVGFREISLRSDVYGPGEDRLLLRLSAETSGAGA